MTASHGTTARAPSTWWSDRWAWRGALAAAPAGALAAILYALLVLRLTPVESLWAYLLGAAVAGGIGCLLAGPLGASFETARYRRREADRPTVQDQPAEPGTAESEARPAHADAV